MINDKLIEYIYDNTLNREDLRFLGVKDKVLWFLDRDYDLDTDDLEMCENKDYKIMSSKHSTYEIKVKCKEVHYEIVREIEKLILSYITLDLC